MCPPEHYAVGVNVKHGEISFNKSTKKKIKFATPFTRKPSISLTIDDESKSPPYKTNTKKDHFWIRFRGKYTGTVSWAAMSMED